MQWAETEADMPDGVSVTYGDIGAGFVTHNLKCYLCNARPAKWYGNPVWMFGPCETCREEHRIVGFGALVNATEKYRQPKRNPWWKGIWR